MKHPDGTPCWMPSAPRQSEGQSESRERIAEGKESEKNVDQGEHEYQAHQGEAQATSHKADEHQGRGTKGQRKCHHRCEAWIRRHATAVEAFSAIIIAIFTAALFLTSLWQWSSMRESNEVARASHRPWVGPAGPMEIAKPLEMGPPSIVVQGSVRLRNFGESVALYVTPVIELAPGHDKLDYAAERTCLVARTLSERGWGGGTEAGYVSGTGLAVPNHGATLFPGQDILQPFGTSVPSESNLSILYIVGCLAYRDQFGNRHRTRFCMETPPREVKVGLCSVYNDAD